eukprot:c24556_g1_i2 orf=415-1149(-)
MWTACPASAFVPFPTLNRPVGASAHLCTSLSHIAFVSKVRGARIDRSGNGHRAVVVMKNAAAASYAAALADIGKTYGVLQDLHSDIEKLGLYLEDPEFFKFITVPIISPDKKKEVLNKLADKGSFLSYTKNLLNIMVNKNRTGLLKDLVKEFEGIYAELNDTQLAVVTSAVKLDKSQTDLIATKIMSLTGAKNVSLRNIVDPSLIAGFMVKFGKDSSRLVDMSVKGQLARIAQQIELSEKVALV